MALIYSMSSDSFVHLKAHIVNLSLNFWFTICAFCVILKQEETFMTVKESVLNFLLQANGAYLSGEQIATSLHVTRAAIWKSIKQLQTEGFSIRAVSNKGYAILESSDIVTEIGINKYLRNNAVFTFEMHDCVTSTNGLMREKTEEEEGYTIVSKEQTRGAGRVNRSFFSPKNTGIYFSLLLKPDLEASETIHITTTAAVAVCKAIEQTTARTPRIKWVNDIYVGGKKICGILTQGSFSMENNKTEYIILGIGINLYEPEGGFPKEITDTAGFLFSHQEGNMKNKLVAAVLDHFWDLYRNTKQKEISELYKQYSLVVGRRVMVHSANGSVPARVLDINEKCNLIVQLDNGKTDILSSGEITITV